MTRILFVCHGNICRSPMAEYMFKKMVADRGLQAMFPEIASRAVSSEESGNPVYPPAARELSMHGIACAGHQAQKITVADWEHFDIIYVMDRSNLRFIRGILGEERMYKVRMLLDRDVADPWYTGDFSTTYSDIEEGLNKIIDQCRR